MNPGAGIREKDVWAKTVSEVENSNQKKLMETDALKFSLLTFADWISWAAVQDNFRVCNSTQLLQLSCHKTDTKSN